jgi:hypothetical protein
VVEVGYLRSEQLRVRGIAVGEDVSGSAFAALHAANLGPLGDAALQPAASVRT